MKALLKKEFGLTGATVTYLFVLAAGMAMIPNYPILVVTMIVCIGLIVTFQTAREARDTDYYALLPVGKRDIVKAKFLFVASIEGLTLLLLAVIVVVRTTLLANAQVYLENPLMNANAAYLGYAFVCFALFNTFFLVTLFKSGRSFVKPSVFFFVALFVCVGMFEALHQPFAFPALNSPDINVAQIMVLALGALFYLSVTLVSFRLSAQAYERADL